jgi:predicted  nucleic acid-binding Zn-ribbon protein
LKEQLSLLISLQECDSHLARLSGKKIKLPEQIKKLEDDFQTYKESVEANKRKFEELKAQRLDCEGKIKKLNDAMAKTKEKMLDVKNNKEYQALLKEIEISEKARSDIETQIIALMDEMDKLAILVKKDEETLKQAQIQHDKEKKSIEDDLNAIDADTVSWTEKRKGLQNALPEELLTRYEKIRRRNNGIGVISVWKEICNGCRMKIPPHLYNELQRSQELFSCPNCNRIIYFENQEKSA